jgi:hypothetical protein
LLLVEIPIYDYDLILLYKAPCVLREYTRHGGFAAGWLVLVLVKRTSNRAELLHQPHRRDFALCSVCCTSSSE